MANAMSFKVFMNPTLVEDRQRKDKQPESFSVDSIADAEGHGWAEGEKSWTVKYQM